MLLKLEVKSFGALECSVLAKVVDVDRPKASAWKAKGSQACAQWYCWTLAISDANKKTSPKVSNNPAKGPLWRTEPQPPSPFLAKHSQSERLSERAFLVKVTTPRHPRRQVSRRSAYLQISAEHLEKFKHY